MSPPEQVPPSAPYLGAWSGSRLQCKKDESGPVKCGTPAAFRIVFRNDGTGSCSGSDFPPEFIYRQAEEGKMTLTSLDKGKTYELFAFKVESEFLSFQYYYYPTGGTEEGEDYIHYVFDLARE